MDYWIYYLGYCVGSEFELVLITKHQFGGIFVLSLEDNFCFEFGR
jgi:hypothetical protein